jgi:predicted HicB family RNase H-like nuclease
VLTQTSEKCQEVLRVAEKLFEADPDWVTFFREVLGIDGVVRKAYPTFEDLTAFEKTEEFDRIQKMVVRLREKKNASDTESEPTRVITVRLPSSMHEYLKSEAHDLHTSMNKLCISKLLQVIEQDLIPSEGNGSRPKPRATTPAPPTSTPTATPMQARSYVPQPVGVGAGGNHSPMRNGF